MRSALALVVAAACCAACVTTAREEALDRAEDAAAEEDAGVRVAELAGETAHLSRAVERWREACALAPAEDGEPWSAAAHVRDDRARPVPGVGGALTRLLEASLDVDPRWTVDPDVREPARAELEGLADAVDASRRDRLVAAGVRHLVHGRLLDGAALPWLGVVPGGAALFLRVTDLTTGRVAWSAAVPVGRP